MDWGIISGGSGGGTGGFGGWGGVVQTGLEVLGQALSSGGMSLPGGTDVDLPGADFGSGDPMSSSLWRQGRSGFTQLSTVVVPSPDGRLGFWKAMGRPILFSGDLAACKRVARVASRASRSVGRSRARGRRRGGR